MTRLIRSPILKIVFLLVAVASAITAVTVNWEGIQEATSSLHFRELVLASLLSLVYVAATMLSWRALLADLGSPLPLQRASHLFFVSQVGKYIPGGVWNVVAVGELGREHQVPRRASLSAMLVFWVVSVTSGLFVGAAYLLGTGATAQIDLPWVVLMLAAGLTVLSPPALRRILRLLLRLLRRSPLDKEPSGRGLATAVAWAMAGWLFAGLQVWILARALSDLGAPSLTIALGGYALAWTAGFLVVLAPAGAGVREVVLASLLGDSMTFGAVVALVLLSRLFITGADLALALAGSLAWRMRKTD